MRKPIRNKPSKLPLKTRKRNFDNRKKTNSGGLSMMTLGRGQFSSGKDGANMPLRVTQVMRYADQGQLTPSYVSSVNFADARSYQSNSIYNCLNFGTGTNETVSGYPTMKQVYGKYWVNYADINITFLNPSKEGMIVGIRQRIAQNSPANNQQEDVIREVPYTYVKTISGLGESKAKFRFRCYPWVQDAVSKLEYYANSTRYASSFDFNPTATLFDIFAYGTQTDATSDVDFIMTIDYNVTLYQRKTLGVQVN